LPAFSSFGAVYLRVFHEAHARIRSVKEEKNELQSSYLGICVWLFFLLALYESFKPGAGCGLLAVHFHRGSPLHGGFC